MAKEAPDDPFSCPICLDALKDPVTIPCGHNYCLACIKDYWDQHDYTEVYSCPECRESFTPRPLLNKNTMFAQVVERFKKARLRDASPQTGKVECSCICSGQKHQAVRCCPKCKESYCEVHKTPLPDKNSREKHTVIVVSGEPRENTCVRHNMRMEIFCRTDQQLICSLCFVESHKGHDAVSVAPKCQNCHGKKQHGDRHRSHDQGRRKHRQSRHKRRHSSRHRKRSHVKSGHEVGHHENHGCIIIRHGQTEGDGHTKGRHASWHRSSRHKRSGH